MKNHFNLIVLSTLVLNLSSQAFAADPATFKVNPDSIRHQVLEGNLSIEAASIQVATAKAGINQARANLAPSLSLGGVINGITSGPSFLLSAVQFLLPFLFPSNWFNLAEEKNLYQAQLVSYQVMELNVYASTLAMYYTIQSDQKIAAIYAQEAKDYGQIAGLLQEQSDILGDVAPEHLEQAQAQAQLAEAQAHRLIEMSDEEIASFRGALNLPLSTELTIDPADAPASEWEAKPLQTTVDQAEKIAPELAQISWLVAAAKDAKWSSFFNFFGSATIGASPSSSGGSADLSSLRGTGGITIGASTFTQLKLSNLNIEAIQFQETESRNETSTILESTVKSIQEAQIQYNLTAQAEKELQDVYQAKLTEYNMGRCSLTTLLLVGTQAASASVSKIQAMTDLNLLRTTLHRSMITDQFGQIEECKPTITRGRKVTIDQLCHVDNSDNNS